MDPEADLEDESVTRLARMFLENPAWADAARRIESDATSTVFFSHRPGEPWRLERRRGRTLLLPGAAADPDFVFRFTPASIERLCAADGGIGHFAVALFGLIAQESPRLRVIGDITCDVEGAVECTVRTTTVGNPVFVYDPLEGNAHSGVEGRGLVVLAVDNRPCELPRESSTSFGDALVKLIPRIFGTDFSRKFEELELSKPVKDAVIAHGGRLTPDYDYIRKYL